MGKLTPFRFTKVIFTIGPATLDVSVLRRMLRAGVDICRINMAHASHEWTQKAIEVVRTASIEEGRGVSILMDIKGPEVRTGYIDGHIDLSEGQQIDLTQSPDATPDGDIVSIDINSGQSIKGINIETLLLATSLSQFCAQA